MSNKEKINFDPSTQRLDSINENLKIIQKKSGLTFGTDSYLLAAFARSFIHGSAVDLGCGTGVISLLCAQRKKYKRITAVEIQKEYADLAALNARINSLDTEIKVINADVRDIRASDIGCEADAVLSNPPYLGVGAGRSNISDELSIARRELNGTIYDFCRCASGLLRFGGTFSVVYRPDRLTDLLCAMRECKIEPKRMVTVYPTVVSRPCLVLIEGKKGAAPSLIEAPPLIVYKDKNSNEYTENMQLIYDNFSFEHILKI